MQPKNARDLKRLWPVGLCWLLMMLGDVAVGFYLNANAALNDLVITVIIGFFYGQVSLAAILGGLLGRSWLAGWLIAVGLTVGGMTSFVLGMLPHDTGNLPEQLAIGALAPMLALAGCGPLMLMRGLRGWSLTLDEQTAVAKERDSIEDLLLFSVVVACSVSVLRIVSAFSRGFSETEHGLVIAAMFFASSLFTLVPATAISFRARNWGQRLLGWFVIAVAAVLACCVIDASNRTDFTVAIRDQLGYATLGIASCGTTMAAGFTAILASGFQLTHYAKAAAPTVSGGLGGDVEVESAEGEALATRRSARQQARWLTGGVFSVTLLVSVWLGVRERRKQEFFENVQQQFQTQGPYAGGSVSMRNDTVVSVSAGENTTDETFYGYKEFQDVERLSLAHSKITDGALDRLSDFRMLQALDLSDTKISDEGLERLSQHRQLNELSVAKTHVSLHKAIEAAKAMRIQTLDISQLGVDDDQLEQVAELKDLKSLALRGNPISDQGVAELLQALPALTTLDLRNTAITGSGLLGPHFLSVLLLDGTQITDSNLIAIMNAGTYASISVKNTSITAQVLNTALTRQTILSLGGCLITEKDILRLGAANFRGLSLNGPEFRGDCLGCLTQVSALDLSHSGVTDAAFTRLTNAGSAFSRSLNLAHTQVTDAILPALQEMMCYELDVRDTQLTARGLQEYVMAGAGITVAFDQFTPAELVALRKDFRVTISDEPSWWK